MKPETPKPSNIPSNNAKMEEITITSDLIYEMACIGCPVAEMAEYLEIDVDSILTGYARELKRGAAKYKIDIRLSLNRSNVRGSPQLLKDSSKTLAVQEEVNEFDSYSLEQLREHVKEVAGRLPVEVAHVEKVIENPNDSIDEEDDE